MESKLQTVFERVTQLVCALLDEDRPGFYPVRLLAVGCSSSEITGGLIGQASSPEVGEAVARAVIEACASRGVDPAFQCCEHLNRALVVGRPVAERLGLETVWVVPQPKAGGSLASAAYRMLTDAVVVESIRTDAGLDIGGTLIGMHLRPVAVPVRLGVDRIGAASVLAARTRPKLIGGERARYVDT